MRKRRIRCRSWYRRLAGVRCIRTEGHEGQHVGMRDRHRVFWPLPGEEESR